MICTYGMGSSPRKSRRRWRLPRSLRSTSLCDKPNSDLWRRSSQPTAFSSISQSTLRTISHTSSSHLIATSPNSKPSLTRTISSPASSLVPSTLLRLPSLQHQHQHQLQFQFQLLLLLCQMERPRLQHKWILPRVSQPRGRPLERRQQRP